MARNWTENDIGDQSGRVASITGANSSVGFEAARAAAVARRLWDVSVDRTGADFGRLA